MAKSNSNDFRGQMVALLPRMRRFAYALTSNMEDADDLVQAACERGLSRQHQWQPGTRLDHWVFRIMYTIKIDKTRLLRSRKVHIPLEEENFRMDGANDKQDLESKLMLQRVLQTMDQLSESDRMILALVCIDGLSYKDAAATLEVPTGTVMSRLARARHRLHELVYRKDALVFES